MVDKCKGRPCHGEHKNTCFCREKQYFYHLLNCETRGKGKHNTGEFQCKVLREEENGIGE